MRLSIRLLYFKDCPNVERARTNVREALDASSLADKTWDEVDVRDPLTPEEWRGFPSPTVLINGLDVDTGSCSAGSGGACRLGGAPAVEAIKEALLRCGGRA